MRPHRKGRDCTSEKREKSNWSPAPSTDASLIGTRQTGSETIGLPSFRARWRSGHRSLRIAVNEVRSRAAVQPSHPSLLRSNRLAPAALFLLRRSCLASQPSPAGCSSCSGSISPAPHSLLCRIEDASHWSDHINKGLTDWPVLALLP